MPIRAMLAKLKGMALGFGLPKLSVMMADEEDN